MLIQTKDLTHRFGGLVAVNNVNYELREGELASIIGPNGAGKSTLFKVIVGTLTPASGRIYFEGKDITNMPAHERVRMGIAKSHQIVQIFPKLTVLENMAIAAQYRLIKDRRSFYLSSWRNKSSIEKAEEVLNRIQLLDKKDMSAGDLPQGEKKRLEVGMALATEPKVLLLDEPTSGSTPVETHQMMDLIRELGEGLTIIVVEHKMDVVMKLAERVSVMHMGRIIADGTPKEIRSSTLVRDVYLGEEFRAEG